MAGNFNASKGILRSNKDINWNGKLVREFIHTNNLSIVNKDQNRCNGFTRITSNSMSILNLALEDNIIGHLVDKLEFDEYDKVLGGSDHTALFFSMRLPNNQQKRDGPQDNELYIRGPVAASADHFSLDNWDALSTQEKCEVLQKALLNAS